METTNKTEAIENEIIALLNKAEIDLNRSEFESLLVEKVLKSQLMRL